MLGRKAIGTVAYMGGIPSVPEPFCWSWGQMVQFNQEMLVDGPRYVHYDRATFSDHAPARNSLCARMLGDWLIQLDCDHQFDPDIVARMVRTADQYDCDVLSATYLMKKPPHCPVLYQWHNDGLVPMVSWDKSVSVVRIGSAGGGALFTRRSVLDRIAATGEQPFARIGAYSEDHSFFLRLRRLGIKAYADLRIESHHLTWEAVTVADHMDMASLGTPHFVEVEAYG